MNVEIRTEAAQFLFWEYINGIFVVVYNEAAIPCYFVPFTLGGFRLRAEIQCYLIRPTLSQLYKEVLEIPCNFLPSVYSLSRKFQTWSILCYFLQSTLTQGGFIL